MIWICSILLILLIICIILVVKQKHNTNDILTELQKYKQIANTHEDYVEKLQTQQLENTDKLTEEYSNKKLELEKDYQVYLFDTNQKIITIETNLKKIKDLQNKVNQRLLEQAEARNKLDFYRIKLDNDEKQDIDILNSVKTRLIRPYLVDDIILKSYYKPKFDTMVKQVLEKYPTNCGIYKITNINDNKVYIGKAKDIKKRWNDHLKESIKDSKIESSGVLYKAIKKEGLENFTFEVIDECPEELLSEREKFWIDFYNSTVIGYNVKSGG